MATAIPQTKKDQLAELVKCGKDPIHFIKNWAKIQHPTRGTIPFATYKFQDNCVKSFEENRFNIILKSRQLGLSTICAAYTAWLALFYKDKMILIIATKLSVAINFIKKVKTILKNLPAWMTLTKFEPSKQVITFDNGSSITAIPTSEDAGRSEGLSLLIVDEAAWIKNFEDIWTGILPTISAGGRAIILSTPNGVGGQYYKLWVEAEAGVNGFNAIKLPWFVHPEHDRAWLENETKSLSKSRISQEYECCFITSGDTFLQPDDIVWLRSQVKDPIERKGHDRNVWVWAKPQRGKKYVISADVSRGDAKDYSAFHIINMDDYNIAAEYMGKVPPERLAEMLCEWGLKYNNALIAPENNTFGYFVCTRIKDAGYRRLYYEKHRGDYYNYTPTTFDEIAGFTTSQKTRSQALAKLEELIRTKQLKVHSSRLVDQLNTFVWNNGRPMASNGNNDDLVMSIAIGCWLSFGGESNAGVIDVEMAHALLKSTAVQRSTFGQFYTTHENNRRVTTSREQYASRHRASLGGYGVGGTQDFSWLLK